MFCKCECYARSVPRRRCPILALICVFFLAAACATAAEPFRFLAIGDSGAGSEGQQRVADQMWDWLGKHPFNLVLMLGDNIYGATEVMGGGSPKRFPGEFDRYYKRFEERGVVFHAVIGNHDRQTAGGKFEIEDRARFGIEGGGGYYKFSSPAKFNVRGRTLVDFFAFNSEIHGGAMAEQVAWLKKSLKDSTALWKVVYMHRPIYTPNGRHGPDLSLRKAIEQTLKENGVQLVLAGHNHFYGRMKPIGHIEYLVSGGGGGHLYRPEPNSCTDVIRREFHFLAFDVYSDKIQFWAVGEDGKIFDKLTIDPAFLASASNACAAE